MTLQLAVLVASVAGAVLFFFGGYLAARSGSYPLPEASGLEGKSGRTQPEVLSRVVKSKTHDGSDVRELDALRTQVNAYRIRLAEAERLGARVPGLEEEIHRLHAQSNTLDKSTSEELNALRDEVSAYRIRLAEAEREGGRVTDLERKIQRLRDEREALAEENRELHEKWKEKTRQAGTLWDERSDLKKRLEQTLDDYRMLKKQTRRLDDLEAERKQTAIKLETMYRQVASLDHYKEENVRMNNLVAEVPYLHNMIDQLKQENRELRSLGLVIQPSAATTRTAPAENAAGSVQQLLEQYSENIGARGVALADEHGLLVAGTSDYAEGLAVTGALCDNLMTQVADILPLGSLRQVVLVDSNAVTAAIYPFRFGPDQLMLASLSVGPLPEGDAIDDLVSQASQLIGVAKEEKDNDHKEPNVSLSS